MKWKIVATAMILSVLIAAGNNVINSNAVPWLGSPVVLQKPPGWPSSGGLAAGAWAGVLESWRLLVSNLWIVVGTLGGAGLFAAGTRLGLKASWANIASTLLRVGFAVMFLAAAYHKITDPGAFATMVAQYQFLPGWSVYPFSLWMPAMELVVAIGLLASRHVREFSFLTAVLWGMFIIALAQALARELGITCGCFDVAGVQSTGQAWFALLRDIVLVPPLAWLVLRSPNTYLWSLKEKPWKPIR